MIAVCRRRAIDTNFLDFLEWRLDAGAMHNSFCRRRPSVCCQSISRFRPLRIELLESRLAQAILTVNSLADGPVNFNDTTITLRDAIEAANANVAVSPNGPIGGTVDEIRFDVDLSGTIVLNQGQLEIRSDLVISGPGAMVLTVSGNKASRVFKVDDGEITTKNVTISGLTITDGVIEDTNIGGYGGGILSTENLTILSCEITENFAGTTGGGLALITGHSLIENSTISGNRTGDQGGGIYHERDSLTLRHSTINGNSARSGGGIFASHVGPITVENSTISGNSALRLGGGINVVIAQVRNSTITQNHSDSNDDEANSSGNFGAGIFFSNGGAASRLTLYNTIVADNFRGSGTTKEEDVGLNSSIFGVPIDGVSSNNLIGMGGSGGLENGVNGNVVGVADPGLGPLADNGGPTRTHALSAGSPAIDKGTQVQVPADTGDLDADGDITEPIPFDQRGITFDRVYGTSVDIGAVELQPVFPWHNYTQPLDVRGGTEIQPDGRFDAGDALAIINYINAFDPLDVPANASNGLPFGFLDVVKDNVIAPEDVLTIINAINARLESEAEPNVSELLYAVSRISADGADLEGLMMLLANDATEYMNRRRPA
jgi:hypothetical protein